MNLIEQLALTGHPILATAYLVGYAIVGAFLILIAGYVIYDFLFRGEIGELDDFSEPV